MYYEINGKTMTRAYNKDYLPGAMSRLGHMMDYAENNLGIDAAVLYRMFLSSGIADAFGSGHPRYIAGLSGRELARLIITSVSDLELSSEPEQPIIPKDAFWAGWVLAYFQWYTGLSFRYIETHGLDIETVLRLFHPLHEADISKFTEVGLSRIQDWNIQHTPSLKTLRKTAGLTQAELAERTGVSLRMIRAYEQGAQDISKAEAASISKLAAVLGTRVESLLGSR